MSRGIEVFDVPKYLLPRPSAVLNQKMESRESLWRNELVTVEEIGLGYLCTVGSALLLGLVVALSRTARRMIYPMLVFIQLIRRSPLPRSSSSGSGSAWNRRSC